MSDTKERPTSPYKHLLAGGVAGGISRTATAPLERIKIFKQVQDVMPQRAGAIVYKEGVISVLKQMLATEGVLGYFKGNGANVLKVIPYNAIRFFSYEVYKKALTTDTQPLTTLQKVAASGCAGATACVGTFPLDLIRTRLALQTKQQRYSGIVNCTQVIVREEGVVGLYKGLGAACLSAVPATAINFTTYETLKELTTLLGGSVIAFSSVNGALAGALSMTALYPLDLCKRRMMMAGVDGFPKYATPLDCLASTVRHEGVRGLYKGISLAYMKVIPAISLTFLTYETTLTILNSGQ